MVDKGYTSASRSMFVTFGGRINRYERVVVGSFSPGLFMYRDPGNGESGTIPC